MSNQCGKNLPRVITNGVGAGGSVGSGARDLELIEDELCEVGGAERGVVRRDAALHLRRVGGTQLNDAHVGLTNA